MSTWVDIANVLVHCLEMYMNCFFFYHVLTPIYSLRKSFFISCSVMTVAMLLTYIDYSNILARQIIVFIGFLVVCRLLYQNPLGSIIFFICISYVLMTVCDLVITFSFYTLIPDMKGFPEGEILLLGNLLWIILYTIVIYVFLIIWKRGKGALLPGKIYITILFPLSQFFMLHAVLYYTILQFLSNSYQKGIIFCAIGGTLCLGADVVLLQMMLDNSQRERMAAQLELMNVQVRRELDYYNSVNEKMQEIRKIRHDFNNQLQTACRMVLSDSDTGQKTARELLEQLEQKIEEAAPVSYCANLIVNVILVEKAREAEAQGISMDITVEFPENIALEKVDLCSIFSNLLDNAIHGAAEVEGERIITVNTWFFAGYYMIKVMNPVSSVSIGSKQSRGKIMGLHGYGLYILEAIAEKYHGEFCTSAKDGIFIANIKLRVEGEPVQTEENV